MSSPLPLSQDGGDGEHASIAVENSMRDVMNNISPSLGDISGWGLTGFTGLTEASDGNQTVWGFTAGDTDFVLTLVKAE